MSIIKKDYFKLFHCVFNDCVVVFVISISLYKSLVLSFFTKNDYPVITFE
jgi:hypothetical protein